MQKTYTILLLLAVSLSNGIKAQVTQYSYTQLSKLFNSYSENDERGLVFVNLYISKAKKERKLSKLISAYDEAVYYSRSVDKKLSYADSAVALSMRSKNEDLMSWAYLKRGIVYYYNKRDYRRALQQYLIAFNHAKHTKDLYMRNKIVYHLGIVRLYLGYYEEAACHFSDTANYYEENISAKDHLNIRLNNESGYLNSIYCLSSCYKYLGEFKKEDSLVDLGLKRIKDPEDFSLELAYFQKGKGIQLLRDGKDELAWKHLKFSERILKHEEDFASLAKVEFYLGKFYWKSGNRKMSLIYFNKVDSILSKFKFITPEINANYQYLISDAKERRNERKQLYYTNRLISIDSVMKADFAYLSSLIHREYDVGSLNEDRHRLLRKNKIGEVLIVVIILLSFGIVYYFIVRFKNKEERLTVKYNQLLEKLSKKDDIDAENTCTLKIPTKEIYSRELIDKVKKNLKIFEEKAKFRDKKLTLEEAAKMVGCKRNALSYILNTHLNTNFTQYLKVLRIKYITEKLMEDDSTYLKYSMDTLAEECGMKNRQVFSNHFLELNGIRPTDFVRKRVEEQNKDKEK